MKVVVDRFEGDYAVLLCGDNEIKVDFPIALLPTGTREGSWLVMHIEPDPEGMREQEEKITCLLDKLRKKEY